MDLKSYVRTLHYTDYIAKIIGTTTAWLIVITVTIEQ
jgi:hypothetical protein